MTAIRDKARDILKVIPLEPQEITSTLNGTTKAGNGLKGIIENPLFKQVTNITHATLQANWDALPADDNKSPGMTSCNGFVGYYGAMTTGFGLGESYKTLGRFDIDVKLKEWGLGNAWVKSSAEIQPKYGDVVLWNKTHIDVSLEIDEDGTWHHADGGQGGRRRPTGSRKGYDIVKRKSDPWNWKQIKGWVDLDILAASLAASQVTEVPDWLPGWWVVQWRAQKYFYRFDKDRTVRWSNHSPIQSQQGSPSDGEPGKYVIDKLGKVIVHWPTGSHETFTHANSNDPYEEQMTGMNGNDKVKAYTFF